MTGLWYFGYFLAGLVLVAGASLAYLHYFLRRHYSGYFLRIFQERPLFVIPRGQPIAGTEEVWLPTTNGLQLHGRYFPRHTAERRGVILFGLEFGSNCWSCLPYCESLLANGFDVFTYESRGQGESKAQPGYQPMQWVTDFDLQDMQAVLCYLRERPDADPRGVGFFGISKGGSVGLHAAAFDSSVRCCLTDGAFSTFLTVVPYMRKWIKIYSQRRWLQKVLPAFYYEFFGRAVLSEAQKQGDFRLPDLERVVGSISPRPAFVIHGGGDTYIKPEMSEALFNRMREPKEFWLVPGAKHNQALHVAGEEYHRRILGFFMKNLAEIPIPIVRKKSRYSRAPRKASAERPQ